MTTCPVCGSDNVENRPKVYVAKKPYGPRHQAQIADYRCLTCGEEGDFIGANDKVIETAHNRARNMAIAPLLDAMNTKGISDSYFERVFGIKQGSLRWWRTDGCTDAEFALAFIAADQPEIVNKLDERCWWCE